MHHLDIKPTGNGFTLIELLVVISIMGILSSVILASLSDARASARDAQRISDLRQIQNALELYRLDNNGYAPDIGCHDTSYGWGCGNPVGAPSPDWHPSTGLRRLVTGGYLSEVPVDPLNNADYRYWYEPHCSVTSHGQTRKQSYYLRARLEKTGGWFYIREEVQSNDPLCHLSCNNSAPPCH